MNDLMELVETLLFYDPCLVREYGKWCRRNGVSYAGAFKVDAFISGNFMDPLDRKEMSR
ncbi:MAG: hypothetical protein JRF59_14985 [Deltaproteobacteria bacterium]|nr:hypothetical protein [Deltaproteobacteria bacterium]MBW1924764.1 hypothetical protein [Deltaproteobacteria bacterium]MBW1950043.1 hypothetical protein [Deltaproteobacteria bacterium]MBW2103691.1 hypothetical protein [Deltaproteobacteria bacterium]MBW2349121.1 hypothetical protein [Deltaproteobacteria bacterium]